MNIKSAALEVHDRDKMATFSGNVHLVQGDTTLRCKTLVVFYDADQAGGPAVKSATPGPTGSSQIRRMEAKGNVIVTQKDQTATGELGDLRHDGEHRHAELAGRRQGFGHARPEHPEEPTPRRPSRHRGFAFRRRRRGLVHPSSPKDDAKPAPATDANAAPPSPAAEAAELAPEQPQLRLSIRGLAPHPRFG